MNSQLAIEPCAGVGATVRGVDLANVTDDDMALMRQAYADYGVLFFRDQQLEPDDHIAFAGRWGEIVVNRFFTPVASHPQIAQVSKEPGDQKNIGGAWHTDHSYDAEPAMGSILVARDLPAIGGDTMFASMAAAYDALSDGLKRTLESLNALHSSRHIFGPKAGVYDEGRMNNAELATQDSIHPVVVRHPLSGRKVLYVNMAFTRHFEGWTIDESKPLLEYLYKHAARPEFTCRFQWQPGSVAFWDNRATWHYALNDYAGDGRLMHRITIAGEALGR